MPANPCECLKLCELCCNPQCAECVVEVVLCGCIVTELCKACGCPQCSCTKALKRGCDLVCCTIDYMICGILFCGVCGCCAKPDEYPCPPCDKGYPCPTCEDANPQANNARGPDQQQMETTIQPETKARELPAPSAPEQELTSAVPVPPAVPASRGPNQPPAYNAAVLMPVAPVAQAAPAPRYVDSKEHPVVVAAALPAAPNAPARMIGRQPAAQPAAQPAQLKAVPAAAAANRPRAASAAVPAKRPPVQPAAAPRPAPVVVAAQQPAAAPAAQPPGGPAITVGLDAARNRSQTAAAAPAKAAAQPGRMIGRR